MHINEDFTTYSKIADIGRWHVTQFVRTVARRLPAGARVLDAGAGECVYARFFSHCRYVGLDLAVGEPAWNYRNLDVISPLETLPFADGSFDAVLSTQTLEHVEHPLECLAELRRALRPGGVLYLTAPMAHMEHQTPHDYFRYTSFGLRSLARRAGFASADVSPFGGTFTRWAYELPAAIDAYPKAGLGTGRLHAKGLAFLPFKAATLGAIRAAQVLLLALDRFDGEKRYPFGYAMVAVK